MEKKEPPKSDKVSLTVDSVVDELIGAGTAAAGIVGGAYSMQLLKEKAKINGWLVSGGGFVLGFGGRLASQLIKSKQLREIVKDLSTGVMTAGALDAAKKGVDLLFPAPAPGSITDKVKKAVPALSGDGNDLRYGSWTVPQYSMLKGLKGLRGPMNSDVLNGKRAMGAAVNSDILN